MEAETQEVYNQLQLHCQQAFHQSPNYFFSFHEERSRHHGTLCLRMTTKHSQPHYMHRYYQLILGGPLRAEREYVPLLLYTAPLLLLWQNHLANLIKRGWTLIWRKYMHRFLFFGLYRKIIEYLDNSLPSTVFSSAKLSREFPFSCNEKQVRWHVSSLSIKSWCISCTSSIDETLYN